MSDAQQALDLFCTGYRLRRATRRVTQQFDHALDPHGLTLTQFGLLAALSQTGAIPIGRLADAVGMDRSSLSRTIKPVLKAGLVESRASDSDRRTVVMGLTETGRARFERAVPAWQSVQRSLMRDLGRDGTTSLHDLLDRVGSVG